MTTRAINQTAASNSAIKRLAAAVLILASTFSALDITPAKADESGVIKLSVRAIQASEPEANEAPLPTQPRERAMKLDHSLKDLEPKLAQLPFASFQLLSAKEEVIALKNKSSMQLPNGQLLIFRPMYANPQKVGLWLNWRERDGSEILNTRLHFDSTDAVLTGTDCPQRRGVILAIRALPAN